MDDVLLNKVSIIQRCLNRIEDEYRGSEKTLDTNFNAYQQSAHSFTGVATAQATRDR